ncbi:MAG TPA: MlaD family protein [Acetobacteraceae bacterium]|jgi:paraquat-inducible protein B|nr:MlaD family protein [Acetobacteraceae bacterium]
MAANRSAIVGGFVLGALTLAVAAILFFGGSNLLTRKYRVVAFFEDSVAGLDIGAPVTFRGVHVGSVQHIGLELLSTGRARIPVVLQFTSDTVILNGKSVQIGALSTEELVKQGLRAQLNLQSFVTGQLRVDLDFLPNTPVHLERVDTGGLPQIPTLPSDLERLRTSIAEIPFRELSQRLLGTLQAFERLSNHLDERVDPLVGSATRGIDTATRTLESVQATIDQLRPEVSHILAEAVALLTDTRHQIDDRGDEVGHLVQSADRAAQHADELLVALSSLTETRSEFRGNLEASLRDLAAASASLRELARALERDPSLVLRGRSGP